MPGVAEVLKRTPVRLRFSYRVPGREMTGPTKALVWTLYALIFPISLPLLALVYGVGRRTYVHADNDEAMAVQWARANDDDEHMWLLVTDHDMRLVKRATITAWQGQAEVTHRGWGAGVRLPFEDGSSVVVPVKAFEEVR
ncbi:hypothetical protein FKR81_25440 [Lentzea tibetensis]|uniref:Uncharacterized protein n=1 Tax=Lentzea tibetensis TaxID=2591470 RepID=A0A563EP90_9PSEU|nr:hypothetical protein [Lentzea tibetensis]TWP49025.1 hypothetical protein FKR81_25440 [Lentzea tibetensis]